MNNAWDGIADQVGHGLTQESEKIILPLVGSQWGGVKQSPNHQQTHTQDGFPLSMTYSEKSILFNHNIYHVAQQIRFNILGDSTCAVV